MKKNDKQTILLGIGIIIAGIMMIMGVMISKAEAKAPKAKFYDFSEQLIDGDIKNQLLFIQTQDNKLNLKDY